MTIEQLLKLELGRSVSVFNEPFVYLGRAELDLEGGQKMIWFYNDGDGMLSVTPGDDELVIFEKIDEELEPDGEMILYQNKEYEFSYEDAGNVSALEGESITEDDDRYIFSDYESTDGKVLRVVSNENTGENGAYLGLVVSEDDLAEI